MSSSIDAFLESHYVVDAKKTLKKDFPEILTLLKENSIDTANFDAVETFLTDCKESFDDYEVIKLTLSVTPNEKMEREILTWLTNNLSRNTNFVVDFEKRKEILGGALVSYRGKYADFSLASKLDNYFKETPLDYAFE